MIRRAIKALDGLSVGVKLSATLVVAVLFTAACMTLVFDLINTRYLEQDARHSLNSHLSALVRVMDNSLSSVDPKFYANRMESALNHIDLMHGSGDLFQVYAVTRDSRLIIPKGSPPGPLPPPQVQANLFNRGSGLWTQNLDDREYWLAFAPLKDGSQVVVVQAPYAGLVNQARADFQRSAMWAALGLAALVAILAAALFRLVLARPLQRLTAEAERVAGGDLTPPEPLEHRGDELGRLSRSLKSMTITLLEMVQEAQYSRDRFQQLFKEMQDAAFIIDEQGRLEDVNPTAVKVFGYGSREEMTAMEDTKVLFAVEDERRFYLEILSEHGFVKEFPATLQRQDGTTFDALITATLRGLRARFGIVRDVTQMRAAQRALLESEERYRRLVENSPDIVYRFDLAKQRFDYISPAVHTITGYTPQELLADPSALFRALHPSDKERVEKFWADQVRGKGVPLYEQEFRIMSRNGHARWLRERGIMVAGRDGRLSAIEGLVTDVTDQKQVERELVKGNAMVEAVLQGLPAAVMVVDRDHKVVHWNRAMERLTDMPAEEVVGTRRQWEPFFPYQRPVLADLIIDMDWEAIAKLYSDKKIKRSQFIGGGLTGEDYFPHLGGEERHLYFLAAPIMDDDGLVVRAVETLVDITDRRVLEEELRRLSVTDDLTGLYNQRFFYATLERELEGARRFGQPLSLLLTDLDHFKNYNDTFGHLEGDKVLATCARVVQAQIRGTDLACRYGGEEFVVLLPRTSLEEAAKVAERIRDRIAALEFFPLTQDKGPTPAKVTVSIGAAAHLSGHGIQDLVRLSDQAMYQAKSAGRNRVVVSRERGPASPPQGERPSLKILKKD